MAKTIKDLLEEYTDLQKDKKEIEEAIYLIREEYGHGEGITYEPPSIKALSRELISIKTQLSQIESIKIEKNNY